MIEKISSILSSVESESRNIPPTLLYNEGWLLRLVLSWFSENRNAISNHPINFLPESRWYSEALLSSPFKAMFKKDNSAEKETHADGVIGNFKIGNSGIGDLKISKGCEQFIVIEAKMYSPLAKGTKNAPSYNQVARSLACMSYRITEDEVILSKIKNLCFFVMLPEEQKEKEFMKYIKKENVFDAVNDRVEKYKKENRDDYKGKKEWFNNSFCQFWEQVKIDSITWEDIIKEIKDDYGNRIKVFYDKCKDFNKREKQPK
jgi:hypothetical protein